MTQSSKTKTPKADSPANARSYNSSPRAGLDTDPIRQLQTSVGNQAMLRMLRGNARDRNLTGIPLQTSVGNQAMLRMLRGNARDRNLTGIPPSVRQLVHSQGVPLDPATRDLMDSRFGTDFSLVRVHSGGLAEQSAAEVNAHAYTVRDHIVFGPGRFARGPGRGSS